MPDPFTHSSTSARTREKLQNLQAEFAHAARVSMLGELMASIAHELNQPLAALAANGTAGLRFLRRPQPDMGKACDALQAIVANAECAGEIIARIRGMAVGRMPQRLSLSLDDVIDEALLFLRPERQAKRVTVSLAPALPPVLGDRTQLQQVIVNLAINAIHAMAQARAAQPILAIEATASTPDCLVCTLEDSCPGIAPEHFTRLFDSFFTTREAGTGMGLAICRSRAWRRIARRERFPLTAAPASSSPCPRPRAPARHGRRSAEGLQVETWGRWPRIEAELATPRPSVRRPAPFLRTVPTTRVLADGLRKT
jgi:C4-dicarboxylate-specific signal transduction histidine kinase